MVRGGELLLIDAAFAQVRPSPWRQAVDLGNMMLVLAVRTDAERVYRRALGYYTPDELAEAFAATRGVASPTQLRAFMKRDPRDLLGEFRALAPSRRPIGLQRWGTRRVVVAAAMLVAALLTAGLAVSTFRSAAVNIDTPAPFCGTGPSMILSAQAVPSSRLLPCIAALPSGWTIDRADITSGRSVFWLDSDQAGPRAVTVSLTARCDTSGAADPVRPGRGAAFRAPAEPAAAVHADADVYLRRRMRHLPVQLRPGRRPPAGHPGRHGGRVRAESRSGPPCPANRGPGALRARGGVLGTGQLCRLPAAASRLSVKCGVLALVGCRVRAWVLRGRQRGCAVS
jgi:hypothetical protein